MEQMVVALFDDLNTAQRAAEELSNNGFERGNIGVAPAGEGMQPAPGEVTDAHVMTGTAAATGVGAVLGGIAGLVAGLSGFVVPIAGSFVLAGHLAATLAGAGLGAAAGGVVGAVTDAGSAPGDPEDSLKAVRRGGATLSVRADESRADRAVQILRGFDPRNVGQRAVESVSAGPSPSRTDASTEPNDRWTAGRGTERGYDRTMAEMSRTFDAYDPDFRLDYEESFRKSGHDYEHLRPAYQYGYRLATEKQYRRRTWDEIEADARRRWETEHPGQAWDDFKDAVRHAYRFVRSDLNETPD